MTDATGDGRQAADRIIEAAAARILRAGLADTSLADIAQEAGVSKALVLYHFHDREALLAELLRRTARDQAARERRAIPETRSAVAVDTMWRWLADEMRCGSLVVLAELETCRTEAMRDAIDRARDERREATAGRVFRLFEALDLRPRIPAGMLADVVTSFETGLVLGWRGHNSEDARAVFDVFWLAMLNLAE